MRTHVVGRQKTEELRDQICHLIVSSGMKEGDAIPSENVLCRQFEVSRITVRRALATLLENKVLRTEKGRGSFVVSADRARALYGKDILNRTVALLLPSISDRYFGSLAQSFETMMRKAGFNTILCISRLADWGEGDYLNELNLSRIDGIALCPFESAPLTGVIKAAIAKYRNVVVVNEPLDGENAFSVSSDDVDGAGQAVKYLLSLGHRHIGMIPGPALLKNASARLQGYQEAMLAAGAFREALIAPSCKNYTENCGEAAMAWLLSLKEPPTAVFCANDDLARGAMRAIAARGLKVPDEISVAGYGNTIAATECLPRLTSIDQHGEQIGQKSAEALLDMIFKRERPDRGVKVQPNLTIRESCAPLQPVKRTMP